MKKITIQSHLDNSFALAKTHHNGPLHCCWFQDDLCILPSDHTIQKHHVFKSFTQVHRTKGLTSLEWDQLVEIIHSFLEREKICQK